MNAQSPRARSHKRTHVERRKGQSDERPKHRKVIVIECKHCGTSVEFETERCPICGTRFDLRDAGLVGLVEASEFPRKGQGAMHCPLCGEQVPASNSRCPSCHETVKSSGSGPARVEPVIHDENVIYLHLDVETGELSYLQRIPESTEFEHVIVQLYGHQNRALEEEMEE